MFKMDISGGLSVLVDDILIAGLKTLNPLEWDPNWKTYYLALWIGLFVLNILFAFVILSISSKFFRIGIYIWIHMTVIPMWLYWTDKAPLWSGIVFILALWHSWNVIGKTKDKDGNKSGKGRTSVTANLIPFLLYFGAMGLYYTTMYTIKYFIFEISAVLFLYSLVFTFGFKRGVDEMGKSRHGYMKLLFFGAFMMLLILAIAYYTKGYNIDRESWRGL